MKVAIVSRESAAPMVARLQAELAGLDLTPVLVERDTPDDLAALAASYDAVAAFSVEETRVQVLIPDRGGDVLRDVGLPDDSALARSLVGVRAAETLRAGLLEVRNMRPRTAAAMSLRDLAASERAAQPPWVLTLGSEVLFGSSGAAPGLDLALGVAVPLTRRLAVAASGDVPIPAVRPTWSAPAGSARITTSTAEAALRLALTDPSGRLVPDVAAGPGLIVVRAVGEAGPGFQDHKVGGVLPAFLLRSGLSWAAVGSLRLRGDLALRAAQKTTVALADQAVGTWGPLFVSPRLAFEWEL